MASSFKDAAEFKIPRHIVLKNGINFEQISGNRTLTYEDSQFQRIDAQSGGLDVILPAFKNGAFFIVNCQGNGFNVKDANGTVIKALTVDTGNIFVCDGTAWKRFL